MARELSLASSNYQPAVVQILQSTGDYCCARHTFLVFLVNFSARGDVTVVAGVKRFPFYPSPRQLCGTQNGQLPAIVRSGVPHTFSISFNSPAAVALLQELGWCAHCSSHLSF